MKSRRAIKIPLSNCGAAPLLLSWSNLTAAGFLLSPLRPPLLSRRLKLEISPRTPFWCIFTRCATLSKSRNSPRTFSSCFPPKISPILLNNFPDRRQNDQRLCDKQIPDLMVVPPRDVRGHLPPSLALPPFHRKDRFPDRTPLARPIRHHENFYAPPPLADLNKA